MERLGLPVEHDAGSLDDADRDRAERAVGRGDLRALHARELQRDDLPEPRAAGGLDDRIAAHLEVEALDGGLEHERTAVERRGPLQHGLLQLPAKSRGAPRPGPRAARSSRIGGAREPAPRPPRPCRRSRASRRQPLSTSCTCAAPTIFSSGSGSSIGKRMNGRVCSPPMPPWNEISSSKAQPSSSSVVVEAVHVQVGAVLEAVRAEQVLRGASARSARAGPRPRRGRRRASARRAARARRGPSAERTSTKPTCGCSRSAGMSFGWRASISSSVSRSLLVHQVDEAEVARAEHDDLLAAHVALRPRFLPDSGALAGRLVERGADDRVCSRRRRRPPCTVASIESRIRSSSP